MRYKLKNGGKPRKKAVFGIDGAIQATATLTAAGIQAAATAKAAKQQAEAIKDSAKTQAKAVEQQTQNNSELQTESLDFTRQQNRENRNQQQEIQTTLQMLAGQQNLNDRYEQSKASLKYGGRPKKKSNSDKAKALTRQALIQQVLGQYGDVPTQHFYGGANGQFKVIDGGGVIPLQTDSFGNGLYELYGNDHDHYHKAQGGKYKSGVGIKFADGSVVEGEGNQNTNQGELMYVTPQDKLFLSKHTIAGFNPAKAVLEKGMNPKQAFMIQQGLKQMIGLSDSGNKKDEEKEIIDLPRRGYSLGGGSRVNPVTQTYPYTDMMLGDAAVAAAYLNNRATAKCGRRVLQNGGSGSFWNKHGGATIGAIGNLGGAAISAIGNAIAGKKLSKAYNEAGNILANAYSQMHGIDISSISREDYNPGSVMAVVRTPSTNVNPQLERIRRDAVAQQREVNRNTLSSAARQQKLAGISDRSFQRMSEQYALKHNQDEQIANQNAERIQNASSENAKLQTEANNTYSQARLNLLQYNNDIENAKITGIAQSRADALTQSIGAKATSAVNTANTFGNALNAAGQGFANSYSSDRKYQENYKNIMAGVDPSIKTYAVIQNGDREQAEFLYNSWKNNTNITLKNLATELNKKFNFEVSN